MEPALAADQEMLLQALTQQQSRHEAVLKQMLEGHMHDVRNFLQGHAWTPPTVDPRCSDDITQECTDSLTPKAPDSPKLASLSGGDDMGVPTPPTEPPPLDKGQRSNTSAVSQMQWELQNADMTMKERYMSTPAAPRASDRLVKAAWTFRGLAHRLLHSRPFELFIAMLIVANALAIGAQAEALSAHLDRQEMPIGYEVADYLFMVAFAGELLLRVIAEGQHFLWWTNPVFEWNILDSTLVIASFVEEITKAATLGMDVDISGARILRLLRLVRLLRVVRVMRFFKDLRVMIMGIIGAMSSLLWAILLLSLIIYVFAVALLQFVTEHLIANPGQKGDWEKDFGSLLRTFYTLFMCISGGKNWEEVSDPLIEIHPVLGALFCMYIAFCCFCVLNIITGVFVDNATRNTTLDDDQMLLEEMESRKKWIEEIKVAFAKYDVDGSGEIEMDEFLVTIQDFTVQNLMKNLGVDLRGSKPESIFMLFDQDGDGSIQVNEFASAIQHMHGNARSLELARLMHQTKALRNKVDRIESMLGQGRVDLPLAKKGRKSSTLKKRSAIDTPIDAAFDGKTPEMHVPALGEELRGQAHMADAGTPPDIPGFIEGTTADASIM
eukprot:TRINITY_DN17784_c0_g1_i1.p1 TRINITY_DN17784_c0_g1~~TRINITY_DN17784_c0_g1_i1.p1  ORF type:complete len:618 (-),score=149.69 TRINITY_DN17784_c0_g1_i1:34-1860(-)